LGVHRGGGARLLLRVHELIRHAVVVVSHLDVVVDVDAARLPLGEFVALVGKGCGPGDRAA
jgi:hypothetical protein